MTQEGLGEETVWVGGDCGDWVANLGARGAPGLIGGADLGFGGALGLAEEEDMGELEYFGTGLGLGSKGQARRSRVVGDGAPLRVPRTHGLSTGSTTNHTCAEWTQQH